MPKKGNFGLSDGDMEGIVHIKYNKINIKMI